MKRGRRCNSTSAHLHHAPTPPIRDQRYAGARNQSAAATRGPVAPNRTACLPPPRPSLQFCVAACYRFYPHAGAEEAIILCLFTAVVLAVLAWSDLHPDRYSWWRELVVPAVRVGRW